MSDGNFLYSVFLTLSSLQSELYTSRKSLCRHNQCVEQVQILFVVKSKHNLISVTYYCFKMNLLCVILLRHGMKSWLGPWCFCSVSGNRQFYSRYELPAASSQNLGFSLLCNIEKSNLNLNLLFCWGLKPEVGKECLLVFSHLPARCLPPPLTALAFSLEWTVEKFGKIRIEQVLLSLISSSLLVLKMLQLSTFNGVLLSLLGDSSLHFLGLR